MAKRIQSSTLIHIFQIVAATEAMHCIHKSKHQECQSENMYGKAVSILQVFPVTEDSGPFWNTCTFLFNSWMLFLRICHMELCVHWTQSLRQRWLLHFYWILVFSFIHVYTSFQMSFLWISNLDILHWTCHYVYIP